MDFDFTDDQEMLRDTVRCGSSGLRLRAPAQIVKAGGFSREPGRDRRPRLTACRARSAGRLGFGPSTRWW
jgi:hypothetical protein